MATGLPSNISAGVSAAGEVKDEQLHEPCSRCFHYAATIEGKLCVWGGLPDHHFEEEKAIYHHDTKSTIEVYDPHLEEWRALPTKGPSPPGYCRGASASGEHYFYVFGGGNYDPFKVATEVSYDSLYQCDVHSCTWMLLSEHIAGGRLATEGCSMVYHEHTLVLFGGHGSTGHIQPGASRDGRYTNELHIYKLKEGRNSLL